MSQQEHDRIRDAARLKRDERYRPSGISWVLVIGIVLAVFGGPTWWVVSSYYEACAYERVTGKHVTTWDAMWLELRVIP